jgi:hypothetical protein
MLTHYQKSMNVCSVYFSTCEVASGFWQIEVDERKGLKRHFVQEKMDSMNMLLYPWDFVTHHQPFSK